MAADAEGANVAVPSRVADSSFAQLVERLSEPGGHFDSDNLISNEASYLHAVDDLRTRQVRGGAYIGVGPDQNFSYIAAIRPEVAFLIDIRRDNLLQHLLFKALFELGRNRAEYLLLLTGREVPATVERWNDLDAFALVERVSAAPASNRHAADARRRVLATVERFGLSLTDADLASIGRIHDHFIAEGLDLRFTSFNRPPRSYYPTLRQLIIERDRAGRQSSYLADEAAFQVVRALQRRDRLIPVVGDLAGPYALAAIGREVAARGLTVSAFYTSNVEFYLMRAGTFAAFAASTAALPRDARSTVIRSCFGYACGGDHPHAVPGYYSVQITQPVDSFAAAHARGEYRRYRDLVGAPLLQLH